MLESPSFPPLEGSKVLVPTFLQEDPTLSSTFASVKTQDEASAAIIEGGVVFVTYNGKMHRVSPDKEQLVVPEA